MKDKDTKLIWESLNEGRRPGEKEIPGHDDDDPIYDEIRGDEDDFDPTDYTSSTDPDDIERYRGLHNLERDIARDRGEEDDPWGETEGEKQTREKYTPEHSLDVLQGLLPKLNEDQFKYLQKALYDAVAGVNDMIEADESRKRELTDFAYDGPER